MKKDSILAQLIAIMMLMLVTTSNAQEFSNRHRLELRSGFWGFEANTSVQAGSIKSEVGSGGVLGAINYSYYLQDNLAIVVGAGGSSVNVDVSIAAGSVRTYSAVLGCGYTGVRIYPLRPIALARVRPYVAAYGGFARGSESRTEIAQSVSVESHESTSICGHLGAGADLVLSRRLLIGINTGYNFLSDFSESIGGKDNYSGPEFAVGLSVLLGRGKRTVE